MMANVYFNRLCLGTITFDVIPERFQEQVRQLGRDKVRKGIMPIAQYEQLYHEECIPD